MVKGYLIKSQRLFNGYDKTCGIQLQCKEVLKKVVLLLPSTKRVLDYLSELDHCKYTIFEQ